MIIGVPKEIKEDEYRVAIVPAGVRAMVSGGHTILIQRGAGIGSGIDDVAYENEGATLLDSPKDIFSKAEMIMKVKEPQEKECEYLKPEQILYTYLHLATFPELTRTLLRKKIIAVAYETVQGSSGELPLLIPMSEVAGRMAIHEGAKYLEREKGGRGILLGGVPGVEPGKVVILGGGYVGFNAAKMAVGVGAEVTILDKDLARLRYIDDIFHGRVRTIMSNTHTIESSIARADLVVGAVLITGATAPKLILKEHLKIMKEGSVIVDVCIDQGGCVESSKPTSHRDPVFIVEKIIHYCVANMPGALARTSTFALTNATFSYAKTIADLGIKESIRRFSAIEKGVNLAKGCVTHSAVARSLEMKHADVKNLLNL